MDLWSELSGWNTQARSATSPLWLNTEWMLVAFDKKTDLVTRDQQSWFLAEVKTKAWRRAWDVTGLSQVRVHDTLLSRGNRGIGGGERKSKF